MSENQTAGDRGERDEDKVEGSYKTKKRKKPRPPRAISLSYKQRAREQERAKERRRGNWTLIFAGLLVIVGAVAAAIVLVPQRADLQLYSLRDVVDPNRPLRFIIVLHNYGQVAARVTETCARYVDMTPLDKWPAEPHLTCSPATSVIPAGTSVPVLIAISGPDGKIPLVISQAVIDEVRTGRRPAYLFGRFSYRDVYSPFLNPRDVFGVTSLPFCQRFVPGDIIMWADCNRPGYN